MTKYLNQKITRSAVIVFILLTAHVQAQKGKKVFIKPEPVTFTRKEYSKIIDSLSNDIITYRADWEKAQSIIQSRDSALAETKLQMLKMQAAVNDLQANNSEVINRNRKLDQSNRILIIFNSVVGILLLTTLIWFLRNIGRKKSPKPKPVIPFESTSTTVLNPPPPSQNNHLHFENKLQQLERLGKLKEKGILNDEEFNFQKQQILSGQ
ncbi:MAG: SHOCT domain-containing protein [Bacteroidia bacterium]